MGAVGGPGRHKAGDGAQHLQRSEAVHDRMVDVGHDHVAVGTSRQAGPQRSFERDGHVLQFGSGGLQGGIVRAVDDDRGIRCPAQGVGQGLAKSGLVQATGGAQLELDIPRRAGRAGRFVCRQPLAVELAAVVALATAQQAHQVARHPRDVVGGDAQQ